MKGDLKNKSKANVTLSVDSNILRQLRTQAESQGLSVNAKINSVLQRHASFYQHTERQAAVTVPRRVYGEIVDLIDEDKLQKLVQSTVAEITSSLLAQNNVGFDLPNMIKNCFESISIWSGLYRNFHYFTDNENNTCLVFEHDFDLKWSKTLGTALCALIEVTLNLPTDYKFLPNTFIIKIKK